MTESFEINYPIKRELSQFIIGFGFKKETANLWLDFGFHFFSTRTLHGQHLVSLLIEIDIRSSDY